MGLSVLDQASETAVPGMAFAESSTDTVAQDAKQPSVTVRAHNLHQMALAAAQASTKAQPPTLVIVAADQVTVAAHPAPLHQVVRQLLEHDR